MSLSQVRGNLRIFATDERGATSVEYALIAGGIFLAIIAVVYQVGDAVTADFEDVVAGFE